MYNPLSLFNVPILEKLLQAGCHWWVRQYYPRGIVPADGIRQVYLLTYYNDDHAARVHYDIVRAQPGAYLYRAADEEDRRRLYVAAAQPAGYKIFINQTYLDWVPPPHMTYALKQYVQRQLGWKGKAGDKVQLVLTNTAGNNFLLRFGYKGMEHALSLHEFEAQYL